MSLITAFALYFIIWWLTLFVVLPIGVRSQVESGKVAAGTDPGAPVRSRIVLKLIANTLLAGIVFGIIWWGVSGLGYGLHSLPSIFPQDR